MKKKLIQMGSLCLTIQNSLTPMLRNFPLGWKGNLSFMSSHIVRGIHLMNLWHIACVHDILNNTPNLTTYWKIPLKIILFNPLPIRTQYTFPISKTPTFTRYYRYPFFIDIFYTPLCFYINFANIKTIYFLIYAQYIM